ncbi:MAG: ATP-grasp domain-containing protein [Deltaproteobacteria bacterium]|nr:ATP-grasp domain-containing protein [Deltaproteobacteria bacterium]
MYRKFNIGVTGLNSTDSPAPGIAVMKCISEVTTWKGRGIGFGYDALDAGLYVKDYFSHSYLLPYPSEGADYLLNNILKVHNEVGLHFIIPTLDSELYNFLSIENDINKHGIMTFLPAREQLESCSKINIGKLGDRLSISVPQDYCIRKTDKLGAAADTIGFPLIVKGLFYEAYKANNMNEAMGFVNKITKKWGMPVILQQYIEGEEYNITAVGDGRGDYIGAVCMKKLYITDKGKAWSGITIKDNSLFEITERFFASMKWRGPLELELIKDKNTGEYNLLEVNPRFPAWIYLAKAAGINLPWLTVKIACGEKVKKTTEYKIGVIFNRYVDEVILKVDTLDILNTKGAIHYEQKTL